MVSRFGSREICDVTFKALSEQTMGNYTFKPGQPVFVIDTATASNMEQATTTVYAQGGKGNNRLMSWEGEKTMTFTVTDALLSPISLNILTGAGFASEDDVKHIHVTMDVQLDEAGKANLTAAKIAAELGIPFKMGTKKDDSTKIYICKDDNIKPYASILDHNGSIVDWADSVDFGGTEATTTYAVKALEVCDFSQTSPAVSAQPLVVAVSKDSAALASKTVKLDFYVLLASGATEIKIKPEDFGGYFYVEADTLYRNQDGKDMAATLTFPKVKIQSGFSISMAATGDPSTFDFVMDAMPGYTYFDTTNKVVCDMTIVSGEADSIQGVAHKAQPDHSKE